ncbi:GPI ethanolamine phosphate transferase 3-like [Octopus sinensis]|uniref:GPI ethanolamine phosphate transferase 3-like n=1 Tax=Octopus sinensis TaxID=2607531 RepID=A0A6P7U3I2_9MOLL|nr:GPI ethanolamine phosphate transferase 3-like [Octopus sinensis]XP_029655469.1 GPI ethanolamine phosphate transferase 3-like [Octopus sinensis]
MLNGPYLRRYNEVFKCLHLHLCRQYGIKKSKKLKTHLVQSVITNEFVEIRVDTNLPTDNAIPNNMPDIFVHATQLLLSSKIKSVIDNETILFVFGDHGSVPNGSHGDGEGEEKTALFVYSKKNLSANHYSTTELNQIEQDSFTPTLAALLGVPIPFQNLGSVINELTNPGKNIDIIRNNALQILTFYESLQAKEIISKYIKEAEFQYLSKNYSEASNLYYRFMNETKKSIYKKWRICDTQITIQCFIYSLYLIYPIICITDNKFVPSTLRCLLIGILVYFQSYLPSSFFVPSSICIFVLLTISNIFN